MSNPMMTHGAVSWSELHAAETKLTHNFYSRLFGWETKTLKMPGGQYTELKLGDRGFGGVVGARGGNSAWLHYFTVDDVDETCNLARSQGGRIVVEPFDAPPGRIARIADPGGAEFFVITYRPAG